MILFYSITAPPASTRVEDYRRYRDTLREQAQKHCCLIHADVLNDPWPLANVPGLDS